MPPKPRATTGPARSVPISSQTVSDPGAALIIELRRLVREFNRAESAALAEWVSDALTPLSQPEATREDDVAVLEAARWRLDHLANKGIDLLLVERLVLNRRNIPLIEPADIQQILARIVHRDMLSDEVPALMPMLRFAVEQRVTAEINTLSAFASDLYQAFWRLAGAILVETASSTTPYKLILAPGARARIYRGLTGPEAWRDLGVRMAALVNTSITASMDGRVNDATAIIAEAAAEATRLFYDNRSREIWSIFGS